MRRILLAPPRSVGGEVAWPAAPPEMLDPPARGRLDRPELAKERRRHLFHPKRGWFRRSERRFNNFLAREFWPRVPGTCQIYDRLLHRELTLSEAKIELPGLPAAFDGLRLLLVTDIHAGPFVSPAGLARTFERLQGLAPDAILLGGDLTTCRVEEFDTHREAFRVLRAPLGVWAVLGNHDHYSLRVRELRSRIEDCGIRVLHNESRALQRDGASLSLAGVDDLLHGEPDLDAALAGARAPVILLSHNPDFLFEAARSGVALMLSGHTHAGQIRLPGLPVLVRQSRYRLDEGRYVSAGTELVVSRGLGAVGLPWRALCPPEAVLLELH